MKVSIVLPSFNHARFLERCLQGVLAQTHTDWELLFLDDGSTDESLEIARQMADTRFRILPNESNLGTYATQNRGLDLASGDLISILNSDDAWLPGKLEAQIELFARHPDAAFCYTRGQIIDDESQSWPEQAHHRDYPTEEVHDVLPYLMNVNQILASSLMFKPGRVRFETGLRYCGDWVAAIRLALQGPALFANEVLTEWRQHPGNASKQLLKTIGEEVGVRRELIHRAPAWGLPAIGVSKLGMGALDLSAHLILLGKGAEARDVLDTAKDWIPEDYQSTAKRRRIASMLPTAFACRVLWPNEDPTRFKGVEISPVMLPESPGN